jgi:hypothetical protein
VRPFYSIGEFAELTDGPPLRPGFTANKAFLLRLGDAVNVIMTTYTSIQATSLIAQRQGDPKGPYTATSWATLDPYFWVDPEQMIDVDGEMVPASDIITLESPDIGGINVILPATSEIVFDFGSGTGIWSRYNNTTWTKLHSLSPEIITTGDLDNN